MESFVHVGKCAYEPGDVVVQVTDTGSKGVWVTSAGYVIYVRTRPNRSQYVSAIFLERPARNLRQVKVLARLLGRRQKELRFNGQVRNRTLAEALLKA